MPFFWLVARHVDRQKRELLQQLLDNGACDPAHAITLAGMGVSTSILRSMVSRRIVIRTADDRYYLDASRMHEAFGASNRFILYAMGAFILIFLAIALW